MPSRRFVHTLSLAIVLAVAALVLTLRVSRGLGLVSDSVYFQSAATELYERQRLASAIAFDELLNRAANGERHSDARAWPAAPREPGEADAAPRDYHPFAAWAPGFPLLIAVFLSLLPLPTASVAAMSVATLGFALAAWALARRLGGPGFAAAAAVAATLSPYFGDALSVASDALGAACTMGALAAHLAWRATREPTRPGWLLVAVALGVAAFWVRYLLAPLLVVLLVDAAVQLRRVRRRPPAWLLVLAGVAAAATLPLLAHNRLLTGHFAGVDRLPSDRSLFANLGDVAASGMLLLPITRDAAVGKLDLLLSGAMTVGLAAALGVVVLRSRRADVPAAPLPPGVGLLLAWCGLYTGLLVVLRTRTLFDEIGARLLLPVLPIVGVVAMASVARRLSGPRAAAGVAVVFAVALAGVHVASALGRSAFGFDAPEGQARADELRGLQGELGATRVFADRVVEVHAALRQPVHWLPTPESLIALAAARPPNTIDAMIVQERSGLFPCAAYQDAYEALLVELADARASTEHFRAYRLIRSPAVGRRLPDAAALCAR